MTRAEVNRLRAKLLKVAADIEAAKLPRKAETQAPFNSNMIEYRVSDAIAACDKLLTHESCPGCRQILTAWSDHAHACKER